MRLALVAGRVPQSYLDQLDRIGESTGKCQSELVREAIAAYLDKTEPASVEKMNRKLNQLEKQVKALMLLQGGLGLASLSYRLTIYSTTEGLSKLKVHSQPVDVDSAITLPLTCRR